MRDIFGSLMREQWEVRGVLGETKASVRPLLRLVEELGFAGVSAADFGLDGEKGGLCWGWAAESPPWSGVRDKIRAGLEASFSLWEVNGRGQHPSVYGR